MGQSITVYGSYGYDLFVETNRKTMLIFGVVDHNNFTISWHAWLETGKPATVQRKFEKELYKDSSQRLGDVWGLPVSSTVFSMPLMAKSPDAIAPLFHSGRGAPAALNMTTVGKDGRHEIKQCELRHLVAVDRAHQHIRFALLNTPNTPRLDNRNTPGLVWYLDSDVYVGAKSLDLPLLDDSPGHAPTLLDWLEIEHDLENYLCIT
jgi:hypothetical protein